MTVDLHGYLVPGSKRAGVDELDDVEEFNAPTPVRLPPTPAHPAQTQL